MKMIKVFNLYRAEVLKPSAPYRFLLTDLSKRSKNIPGRLFESIDDVVGHTVKLKGYIRVQFPQESGVLIEKEIGRIIRYFPLNDEDLAMYQQKIKTYEG